MARLAALESILFIAGEPLTLQGISECLGITPGEAETLLQELEAELAREHRGLQLVRQAGGYQLATKPQYHQFLELLAKPKRQYLSQAALETMAVVAYRQPVTKAEIEALRGVHVDGVLGLLLDRELIIEKGRRDGPGRPLLYGTTDHFLDFFGLDSLDQLPLPVDVSVENNASLADTSRECG